MSAFPLQRTSDSEVRELGQVLWSWQLCAECRNGMCFTVADCPAQRTTRLVRFLNYFKDVTASYEPGAGLGKVPAISTHTELFEIIRKLKSNPDTPRAQLTKEIFVDSPGRSQASLADQDRAINLAVRVMIMVNCSAQRQPSELLEYGVHQIRWHSDVTFSQFIEEIFPMTDHPGLNDDNTDSLLDMRTALTAKKLRKRAGLSFRPTNDLRSHLKLDRRNGVVEIYHHTAFLKEHLRMTKEEKRGLTISESLRIGALPRQLVLEVLDSIQKILFPPLDPKSRAILLSLTTTSGFDPDALRFESTSIRNADEKDIAYHYLGARLADLYEELENPKPRGLFEKWLERKSGARHLMFATLVGVLIAIILGMVSIAVGAYQAWVTYQAWKNPVSNPPISSH